MASKTDLAGYLRHDPGNVSEQMEAWLVTGDPAAPDEPPRMPARIRVLYRAPGTQSEEVLHELTIQTLPASAPLLVDAIESAIVKKLGPTPIGRLRIRGFGTGSASNPGLDVTRTLSAGEETGDVAMLRAELARKDRENRELRAENTQLGLGAMTLATNLGGHLATLSYTRANGNAVADMGGFAGLIGGMVLLILKPHIEASLRGEDGPFRALGDRLLGLLLPAPAGQPSPKRQPTTADLVQVIQDPKVRDQLARELEGKVPGVRALLEAAAEASVPASPTAPATNPVDELLPSRRPRPPASSVLASNPAPSSTPIPAETST